MSSGNVKAEFKGGVEGREAKVTVRQQHSTDNKYTQTCTQIYAQLTAVKTQAMVELYGSVHYIQTHTD